MSRLEAETGTRGRQDGLMKIGELTTGEDETLDKAQIGKLRQFWSKLQEFGRHCLLRKDLFLHQTAHSIVLGC